MNKRDLYRKALGRILGRTWIPVTLVKLSTRKGARWHILVKNEKVPIYCEHLRRWKRKGWSAKVVETEIHAEQIINNRALNGRLVAIGDHDIFTEDNDEITCYNCTSAFRSFFWHQFNNKEEMDFEQTGLE